MKHFRRIIPLLLCATLHAQIQQFPYIENFDTVTIPSLPRGWSSSTNRSPSGDFTTTKSSPYSDSVAVISTNATVEQELVSPLIDFSSSVPDSLFFYERRSSSHNSGVILETSTDGGSSFDLAVGDTFKNTGTTSYSMRGMKLPSTLSQHAAVCLRWHVLGDGTGTSGTIRIDNVRITTHLQFDLALQSLSVQPLLPQAGMSVIIQAIIKNVGVQAVPQFTTLFYLDSNKNNIADGTELFCQEEYNTPLDENDSASISVSLPSIQPGITPVIAVVSSSPDQNHTNDTLEKIISTGFPLHSIVVNEIMYAPSAGNAEYVELYNPSPYFVNIQNWKLSDKRDTNNNSIIHIISRSPLILAPGQFFVVASDSSIFEQFYYLTYLDVVIKKSCLSLNNDGDQILLCDLTGTAIDSLYYSPGWNNPALDDVSGKSLERINPLLPSTDSQNWTTSASPQGGTPGRINSVFTKLIPSSTTMTVSPNPFSPDGDGFEDVTMISYHLPLKAGLLRVRIYDAVGRLVRVLADGAPTGSAGTLVWDGMSDRKERVRIGIYVIFLEAYDPSGNRLQMNKGVVVVATKL
jgi:hypothetical protein